MKTNFEKWRRCSRGVQVVCLIGLLIPCCQLVLLKQLKTLDLEWWFAIHLALSRLFMLVCVIGLVLCLLTIRYSRCPYCGKSVLSRWWNYGLSKQIAHRQTIICPHCGKTVETA